MEHITRVPQEFSNLIPTFNGDSRLLPLFIKKSEYILRSYQGDALQNEYLYHVVTSRLSGEAANLVGERDSISTWEELKELLCQHFGDPRTEDCIAMELESCKIVKGESYLDFCHRLQHIRSVLFSKLFDTIQNDNLRLAKQEIYNYTTFNVFLYNLPPFLVRLVRIRGVNTLEEALKIVLEEQNFQTVYDSKNHMRNNANRSQVSNNLGIVQNRITPRATYNNPRVLSTPAPNSTQNSAFSSPNNSFQQRNQRPFNNFNNQNNLNNSNNYYQWQRPNRASTSQTLYNNQHWPNNAPRFMQHNQNAPSPSPVASGSNTDVTMRTASSRRVNYTDTNDSQLINDNNMQNSNIYENNYDDSEQENFIMTASITEKK
jgi:hypothetical protein